MRNTLGFLLLSTICITAHGQANTKLSNLVAPTAVNADLLPGTTNTRSLGSSTLSWKNLYLRGDVYLDGTRFLSNAPGVPSFNTFVGAYSGASVTRGINNTAIGYNALYKDTSGSDNTAIGPNALYNNTRGFNNIAIGRQAMFNNKEGFYNIGIGDQSLLHNNGSGNIGMGLGALAYNTIGRYNVAVGSNAMYVTTSSEYNTAIGSLSGNSYNNGYNNVFVGANTDVNGPGYYNVIVIGQGTIGTNSSQVTIGNPATNSYRAYAGWSNISDGRFKQDIKEDVPGLAFISKLRPVTYRLKAGALDQFLNSGQAKENELSSEARNIMNKALREKEAIMHTGFVAQEVEQVAKELGFEFSGVEPAKNDRDVYALKYGDFVVPLVKAVQELSKDNEQLKEVVNAQQQQINELRELIQKLAETGSSNPLTTAFLKGSTPNPAQGTALIHYFIPHNSRTANLVFTDMKGAILKSIPINTKGDGQVSMNTAAWTAGTYTYTLYINGTQTDSRKLVIAR